MVLAVLDPGSAARFSKSGHWKVPAGVFCRLPARGFCAAARPAMG
jgi:hypothetical protein